MKFWGVLFSLALCLCLLTSCGEAAADVSPSGQDALPDGETNETTPSLAKDEEAMVISCRIVDGAADRSLLLAELEDGLYGGTGVYRLNVDGVPVTLDGEPADASVLEDGMPVDIAFNGNVLETFPAQLGEVYSIAAWSRGHGKNPMGTEYDLCGLYLQVLNDLWNKDPALNEDISIAGLDLSEAPGGLAESEKAALTLRFGELHGVEAVAGTFDELEEQGYFTSSAISTPAPEAREDFTRMWTQWEDGCLFSITANKNHADEVYSLPVLHFNADKWRGPLAAYSFYDCFAAWGEAGTWSGYQIESEMIS